MLQPSILGLFVCKLAQSLKLRPTHLAHTQPRLFQHLHILQRPSRLAQLAKFLEADFDGKLFAELDVHEIPLGLFLGGRGVVVRCPGLACGSWLVSMYTGYRGEEAYGLRKTP